MKHIIVITLSLFLTLGIISCQPGQANTDKQVHASDSLRALPVKVMTLQKVEEAHELSYPASIEAMEAVHMAPAQPGRIDKIFVEIGDHVRKGDILAEMDQTQLKQAEIQLKQLEVDYNRMKILSESNTISQQQYDQVKVQYDVAQTNVAFLKENTSLKAPFNGVITGKYFENGEMYSGAPNTQAGKAAILTLEQIEPVKAIVGISEKYFTELHTQMEVELSVESYPGQSFTGTIKRIHPTINPATRTFNVEVVIPNKDELLRPGMYGKIHIRMGSYEALMVPSLAVLQQQGTAKRFVYLNRKGKAQKVNVEIGKRYNDQLEILSDQIQEGDVLVISGQRNLMDEQNIKIVE